MQERDNIIKKYSNDTKEDLIDLVIEKDNIIDNLQSKIDKANEIINKLEMQPAYLDCKYYELEGFKELKDILKEVENVENN